MSTPRRSTLPRGFRESTVAALFALLLGVIVVGRPVWDGEQVYLATDTACAQAPWHSAPRVRNPELSDQGVAFYPHYRRVSESWRAGEVPLWNPDLYVGLPLLANPQWGALDPQVLALVGLDALGGERLFDRGLAWLAVLRVAAAALGAFLLGRKLGLERCGAALAGLGFGLSGSLVLWLGFSLAHVIPFLPWVILGVESQAGRRPALAFGGTALAMAGAIYGGHPETAFFVGFAAGWWAISSLGEQRRSALLSLVALTVGVLLSAPVLLPFIEYLENSGALVAHGLASKGRGLPDLVALGALLLFGWIVWSGRPREGDDKEVGSQRVSLRQLGGPLPFGIATLGLLWVLDRRGLELGERFRDGAFLEGASVWLSLPILGLALAALFGGTGRLRRGPLVVTLGMGALLLALAVPGAIDLWRWLPLVGLAAPARAACLAALFLSLMAGAALDRSSAMARGAGFGALLLIGGWILAGGNVSSFAVELARLDPADEIISYEELPPAILGEQHAVLRGQLHGGLDIDALSAVVERLDSDGRVVPGSSIDRAVRLDPENEAGTRRFDTGELDLSLLEPGAWRFRLEFHREGKRLATRNSALTHVERKSRWRVVTGVVAVVTGLLLFAAQRLPVRLAFLLLALLHGVGLARDWNPAVPRAEHFPLTSTETLIAERYPGARILGDLGILPGDTALVRGLTTVDGYDAMDVASFDGFRAFALKRGANPLLDWNASGIDPASPGFLLLGVELLLFHEARELAGWRLVAAPEGAPAEAEVWIYEAEAPLPRAWCASNVVPQAVALANLARFDPRTTAFLEPSRSMELERPFDHSRVEELQRGATALDYEVELDGEGLFILAEQHFPGWQATVDGRDAEVLRVNSIYRGLYLPAGLHQVHFEYRPFAWSLGKLLGLVGLGLLAVGSLVSRGSWFSGTR